MVGSETGRFEAARVEREQNLCQRCEGNEVVTHMSQDCSGVGAERLKYWSLFARERGIIANYFEQDPIELAASVHKCYEACKE